MASKLTQLSIAAQIGFKIPASIASSSPPDISRFVKDHDGDCIMKAFYKSFIPGPSDGSRKAFTIMTNSLRQSDLEEHDAESFSWAPCLFQTRIKKAYELRVVATPYNCIAYKIDSQGSELGKLDWRHAQFERIFSPYELNLEHKRLFTEFLNRTQLHYGVFDAVVTEQDDLVFIECNADGQWAWLERDCESDDITEAIFELAKGLLQSKTDWERVA